MSGWDHNDDKWVIMNNTLIPEGGHNQIAYDSAAEVDIITYNNASS